ncbi:enoyl-CoA hydratase-related protein [Limnohabitans sp.]|uniref:enoyl-CoA hydratase-related protein n=1 Tax=Limnohabitans sp. TaxID=1907725 RepID=UPI00311EF634
MSINLNLHLETHVAHLQLCNTATLNALSIELCKEIDDAVKACDEDSRVKAVLISSAAKHFCAGADISEMSQLTPEQVREQAFAGCVSYLARARKPIVVAVNGMALGGGCELVEMCDVVVAGKSAKFGHPEITLAAMPGAGGTQRLTRAIGKALSLDMLLTARSLTADVALQAGLVSRVVDDVELQAEAMKIAEKIASFSAPVAQRIKACVRNSDDLPLDRGLVEEMQAFHECFREDDFKEGLASFMDKRRPSFRH